MLRDKGFDSRNNANISKTTHIPDKKSIMLSTTIKTSTFADFSQTMASKRAKPAKQVKQ